MQLDLRLLLDVFLTIVLQIGSPAGIIIVSLYLQCLDIILGGA